MNKVIDIIDQIESESNNFDIVRKNIAHVREWTFNEFASYISFHFDITFHEIVNKNQATQMIIAKIKKTEL